MDPLGLDLDRSTSLQSVVSSRSGVGSVYVLASAAVLQEKRLYINDAVIDTMNITLFIT